MSKQNELVELARTGASGGGNKNLIINGAMQVAQRGTSVSVTDGSNEGYQTLDRWRFNFGNNAGGACTVSQDTDVPSGYGFSNSYKVDVTTADTSIASTQHILFAQRIEAQDLRSSGWNYTSSSSYLTLSFWIKSNKTGVYCVSATLPDVGSNFRFVKEVTVNSASTWEYKTVKIFGDSSAIINNDNGIGMDLEWNLQTASDRDEATDNAWHTADASRCTSNQVNFFDSTSNNLWITGVQLEVGGKATDFEHRTFADELAKCRRYFISTNPNVLGDAAQDQSCYVIGAGYNSKARFNYHYAPMRTMPAGTVVDASGNGDVRIYNSSSGSAYSGSWSFENTLVMASFYTSNLSSVNGKGLMTQMGDEHDNSSLYLELDAEI